jgi:hypothetical protein
MAQPSLISDFLGWLVSTLLGGFGLGGGGSDVDYSRFLPTGYEQLPIPEARNLNAEQTAALSSQLSSMLANLQGTEDLSGGFDSNAAYTNYLRQAAPTIAGTVLDQTNPLFKGLSTRAGKMMTHLTGETAAQMSGMGALYSGAFQDVMAKRGQELQNDVVTNYLQAATPMAGNLLQTGMQGVTSLINSILAAQGNLATPEWLAAPYVPVYDGTGETPPVDTTTDTSVVTVDTPTIDRPVDTAVVQYPTSLTNAGITGATQGADGQWFKDGVLVADQNGNLVVYQNEVQGGVTQTPQATGSSTQPFHLLFQGATGPSGYGTGEASPEAVSLGTNYYDPATGQQFPSSNHRVDGQGNIWNMDTQTVVGNIYSGTGQQAVTSPIAPGTPASARPVSLQDRPEAYQSSDGQWYSSITGERLADANGNLVAPVSQTGVSTNAPAATGGTGVSANASQWTGTNGRIYSRAKGYSLDADGNIYHMEPRRDRDVKVIDSQAQGFVSSADSVASAINSYLGFGGHENSYLGFRGHDGSEPPVWMAVNYGPSGIY